MKRIELAPCPFCGHVNTVALDEADFGKFSEGGFSVCCDGVIAIGYDGEPDAPCKASGPYGTSMQEAIDRWNSWKWT